MLMHSFRPRHHITAPFGWLNDPNGAIHWRDSFHVFYQHNPDAPVWGTIRWGHAVSCDLAEWRQLPIALTPDPSGPDSGGCWSGCAVDDDGVPAIIYTGVTKSASGTWDQSICVARGNEDLTHWIKDPANPVIPGPPAELRTAGFRDPFVWRDGDQWSMIVGSGIEGLGGAIFGYRSDDLRTWTYTGIVLQRDARLADPISTGTMWECPHLFSIGDRHGLIISIYDNRDSKPLNYPIVFLGTYRDGRFTPEELRRFDHGPDCYAPQVMVDRQGRNLLWGWSWEARDEAAQREQGWASALTFPRELFADRDGGLGIRPARELEALRAGGQSIADRTLAPDDPPLTAATESDHFEIALRLDPANASAIRLELSASPDGDETTVIEWNRETSALTIDRSASSLDPRARGGVHGGELTLGTGEELDLRVFVDVSIAELFANDRFVATTRIYPTREDSRHIRLTAVGGEARLIDLQIWDLIAPDGSEKSNDSSLRTT
jgi:beta-fructofuranosidase